MFTPAAQSNALHPIIRPLLHGLLLPGLLLPGLLVAVASTAIAREVPPYEGRFTPKSDRMYSEDIHAWAYSASFAERFRMPAPWIEPDLAGAVALAYRVEYDAGRVCGHGGEHDCRRRVRCVLDAYFEGDVPGLFANDLGTNHNPFGDDRPARFLSPQREADFTHMRNLRQSVRMPGEGILGYQDEVGRWRLAGRTNTYQHERRALAAYGVVSASFALPCALGQLVGDNGKGATQLRLWLTTTPVHDADTLAAQVAHGGGQLPEQDLLRTITVPASYLQRLAQRHREKITRHGPAYDESTRADWRIGPYQRKTYAERFTAASGERYDEDNHVWVYSRDFAQRFGMPEQWIDDNLRGAHAVAYWLNEENTGWCGFFGDPGRCKTVRRCMMDVYLPKDADLPWYEPVPVNHKIYATDYSLPILSPDTETFRAMRLIATLAEYSFGEPLRNGTRKPHSFVMEIWTRQSTFFGIPYGHRNKHSGVWMHEYDRRLFGMDRLRMSSQCVNPKGERIQVSLGHYGLLFTKGGIDLVEFQRAYDRSEYAGGEYDTMVAHRVEIPLPFLQRIYDYQYENYQPISASLINDQ